MNNKAREILRNQIKTYLIENQIDRTKLNAYKEVADKFGVNSEYIRSIYRKLRAKGLVESTGVNYIHVQGTYVYPASTITSTSASAADYEYTYDGDNAVITRNSHEEVRTLEDLIRVCEIDTDLWTIDTWQCKKWDLGIKNKKEEIETKALFSVSAKLKKKTADNSAKVQKNFLIEEFKQYVEERNADIPKFMKEVVTEPKNYPYDDKANCCLEINIPDLHIGKLAWGKESGEDYDIKIASKRFRDAIRELLNRTDISSIGRILLPVGNDLINVDSKANMTTAGTPQSCDSRFGKMFQAAKDLLIETIDVLSIIAPVDVVIIPGNHDNVTTFTLGEVLEAWYHTAENVNVFNTHAPRKYYQYGKNLIMYVHGDREKLNDLGIICATEQPQLWADTKYRRVHVGHFHHSKQIKFTDVQEFPGFTVKILNSLSANDAWHSEKGYISLKQAEAFLYHKDKGLLANYYYQI